MSLEFDDQNQARAEFELRSQAGTVSVVLMEWRQRARTWLMIDSNQRDDNDDANVPCCAADYYPPRRMAEAG